MTGRARTQPRIERDTKTLLNISQTNRHDERACVVSDQAIKERERGEGEIESPVSPANRLENSNEDVPRVYLGSRYSDDWSVPQGR